MTGSGWTFDELLRNGWFPHWLPPQPGPEPFALEFTWYRSEIARHTVEASGATEDQARARAAELANAWLRDHPEYRPKRPPAAARTTSHPPS